MDKKSAREKILIRGFAALSGLMIATSLFMGLLSNESVNAQSNTNYISVPLTLPGATALNSDDQLIETTGNEPTVSQQPLAEIAFNNKNDSALINDAVMTSVFDTADIEPGSTSNAVIWNEVSVKKGDTLSAIFDRNNIHSELDEVLNSPKAGEIDPRKQLTRIRPGEVIKLDIDVDGLKSLQYAIDETHYLTLNKTAGGFLSKITELDYQVQQQHAIGIIDDSLFGSASEAGLTDNLIMQLASIFGYDIDFALDIRKGDSYKIIYEERFIEGEIIKNGDILAAEFTNNTKTYQAVFYTDANNIDGYYNPEGRNMKKAFLRTPVNFTRISSKFNLKRKHPILHKIRAHKGVDYAAPRGTPVKSAGKGKIIYRAVKGGYGKAVIIQHGSSKSTLYGHLNNFRKGHKVGSRVKQGEVIGYVGRTGRATGPHLHYEFRVNGVHRNPLTVKLPKANPLPAEYLMDFQEKSEPYLAWLSSLTSLASTD